MSYIFPRLSLTAFGIDTIKFPYLISTKVTPDSLRINVKLNDVFSVVLKMFCRMILLWFTASEHVAIRIKTQPKIASIMVTDVAARITDELVKVSRCQVTHGRGEMGTIRGHGDSQL